MNILSTMENDYYKWLFVTPNEFGMTHFLHDKKKDEWFFVHATTHRFPVKETDGVLSTLLAFRE